jgi:hypothetical protein
MTLITFQDGKVVMRDGKIGTEQECCCEDEAGPCVDCDNLAYDECPESFEVTFDTEGAFDPDCNTTLTYTITKDQLNADDPSSRGWQGGEPNFVSVTLFCSQGRWALNIGADNFPFDCVSFASILVDLGSACECPQAGTYTVPEGQVPAGTTVTVA